MVQVADSSNVTYSVTEDTQGSPDMETLALSIDRIVSKPFSVSSLDAGSVSVIVELNYYAPTHTPVCDRRYPGVTRYGNSVYRKNIL